MKIKDYWRLAKISLKARKKSTNNTIRGMAFGLIIIVPLLFMMLGINQSIMAKLNKDPDQLYATFYSAEKGSLIKESRYEEGKPQWQVESNMNHHFNAYSDHSSFFENNDINTLHYSMHYKDPERMRNNMNGANTGRLLEKITVGDTTKELYLKKDPNADNNGNNYGKSIMTMAVVKDEVAKANTILTKQFVDGMNKGFDGNGASQVILNERYLKYADLTPADVYGKKVSVYYRDATDSNMFVKSDKKTDDTDKRDENIPDGYDSVRSVSHHLFREFEVVGVIKDAEYGTDDIRNSCIIVTGASYYDNNGKPVLAPTRYYASSGSHGNIRGYIYGDVKAKEEMTDRYVFPGGTMWNDRFVCRQYTPGKNEQSEVLSDLENNVYLYIPKDYNDLDKTIKKVAPDYDALYNGDTNSFASTVGSSVYANLLMINMIFNYAMLFGGVVAGVILFAALINLFNSIKHSVDSRRNYLGVMKAIGARNSTIPKLYFFEVMRIFLRAFVRIFIIGTIICVGIMVGLYYMSEHMPFKFIISWTNIPIVMGILAVILVGLGFVYSMVCSFSMSRKPITELLED